GASVVTEVILVFLLLLLLLVLALAWHKLSRDSDGKYHPRRLCQPHRLLASLATRWRKEEDEDEDEENEEEEEEEEENLQRDEEEGGGGQEQQHQEEATDTPEGTPPRDAPDGAQEEAREAEGTGAGGLLSDLHAFSGTATWEDSAVEGGSRQHITAL
uniref:Protein tyrosine phosphatase receptor type C associated protein n=1 Tax=Pelodiscus sinensis TaxID=13735 RepID=K7FBY1_PELSI